MSISKAQATWNGGLKDGKGMMKPEHAGEVMFSLGTRFEGQPGSNPEEMIGAALCGCFSMALSMSLEQNGFKPEMINTMADVGLEKDGAGFSIKTIMLKTKVKARELDAMKLKTIAEETKKNCPVSKALGGVKISLEAAMA